LRDGDGRRPPDWRPGSESFFTLLNRHSSRLATRRNRPTCSIRGRVATSRPRPGSLSTRPEVDTCACDLAQDAGADWLRPRGPPDQIRDLVHGYPQWRGMVSVAGQIKSALPGTSAGARMTTAAGFPQPGIPQSGEGALISREPCRGFRAAGEGPY
jgi:hypothetical protein